MSPVLIALLVIGGGFLLLIVIAVGMYNSLVALKNRYKNAFSQIDVQLKRRHDLIPNLVETAKAYLKFEKDTLVSVISARNAASTASQKAAQTPGDPVAMKELAGAETSLNGALGRLFAVVEQYPDLKANQNMARLMEELSSTENKIAFARQAYNDSVMTYNTSRESFPNSIIANMFGFTPAELFQLESAAEKEVPKVSF